MAMKPAKLTRRGHGFYTWNNGRGLGHQWLSANIYRDREDAKHRWVIRYFAACGHESVLIQDGVWTLRMVRGILARVASAYDPDSRYDRWLTKFALEPITHDAWLAAADEESET